MLNDLVRDLGLPKNSAEILGSGLQSEDLLSPDISFSQYLNHHKVFIPYSFSCSSLVYCSNISGLMCKLGVVYVASE